MSLELSLQFLLLSLALVQDFFFQKIKNQFLLSFFLLSLGLFLIFLPFKILPYLLFNLFAGFLLFFPFYFFKILGAGDVKLIMIFAFLNQDIKVIFLSFAYALPWALVLGLSQTLYSQRLGGFFKNLYQIVRLKKVENSKLHKMPFAVALFFGFLSFLVLKKLG